MSFLLDKMRLDEMGWHPNNYIKAYLSAQASSLSPFVISKTQISGRKQRGRQLNAIVCSSKSAIFL